MYHPSAGLITDVGKCADETDRIADEADRVNSVGITMQDVLSSKRENQDEMEEDEDMRDDNGNPFMVLHVNQRLGGSARLYCKKVPHA